MIEKHPDLRAALSEGTFLGQLPPEARERLLAGARVIEIPHGGTIFSAAEAEDRIGVVVRGIARTHLNAVDGRRCSVGYAREGHTIGSIMASRAALSSQAVSDCTSLQLDSAVLGALIVENVRVGLTLIVEIARRLVDTYATLAANTFGTMRDRVARQLLDVATEGPTDGALVALLTQQGLADGVRTVREAIARVLRDFRTEGLVKSTAGQIEIVDPDGLAAIVGRWGANDRQWPAGGSAREEQ